jgi:hypothetical protein
VSISTPFRVSARVSSVSTRRDHKRSHTDCPDYKFFYDDPMVKGQTGNHLDGIWRQ